MLAHQLKDSNKVLQTEEWSQNQVWENGKSQETMRKIQINLLNSRWKDEK